MAKFKVGDRVRIVNPQSEFVGREASVMEVSIDKMLTLYSGVMTIRPLVYRVSVDGYGDTCRESGRRIGYEPHELAPLTPPAVDTWASDAVRKVTKPIHVEPTTVKEKA